METQVLNLPPLEKSTIRKVTQEASSCCAQPANEAACCVPSQSPQENNGACCAQPEDGSACCNK